MSKSQLKAVIKTKIAEKMKSIVIATKNGSKKMRFSSCNTFERKPYVIHGSGKNTIWTIKTRLNMWEVYGNYKGNYKLPRVCPHCDLEEDTTEHLLMCSALGPSQFTTEDLEDESNVELWKQMVERINTNMKWRDKY